MSTQSELRKFLPQRLYDSSDLADRLGKEWDDSLKFGTTNLLERYRAMKLGLHLHLRIGCREKVQACAVFQGAWRVDEQPHLPIFPVRETNPAIVPNKEAYGDEFMLVGVIELVQHPKGLLVRGSPSLVRLHPLNDCLNVGGRSLYHGHRSGFVFIGSLKDGELRLCRGGLIVNHHQLPNEVIECGPKLICDFTGEQDQLDRWVSEARIFGKESDYARLEITLYPNGICTRLKGSNLTHEFIEVLYGPFNLGPDSI